MRLRGQLAQRHFCPLQGFALGAESRITQTWASVFTGWAIAKTITTTFSTPIAKAACPRTSVTTGAGAALARASITAAIAPGGCLSTLLAGSVVAAHCHHGFGRLGGHQGCCRLLWCYGVRFGPRLGGIRGGGSAAGLLVSS